jgi:hypothetical protein
MVTDSLLVMRTDLYPFSWPKSKWETTRFLFPLCCTLTAHFSRKESQFDLYTVSIVPHIVCYIVYDIVCIYFDIVYDIFSIVFDIFKAQGFDAIHSALKEELHQLLIGLYGEHLLPATMYEIKKTLRNPNTIRGFDKNGAPIYIISKQQLKTVFSRLRNRLSSLDSSTSTIPREAAADLRPDTGTGSRLFEINMWMWRYGRTFPRQISVDQAVKFRKKRVQESRARGAETLRRRRDAAWEKGASAPQ